MNEIKSFKIKTFSIKKTEICIDETHERKKPQNNSSGRRNTILDKGIIQINKGYPKGYISI